MAVVKVNWSGGKDSTCATMLHLQRGDVCKVVNYIPMLNDTIPLIRKDHYEFILATEDYFLSLGAKCYRAKGISYLDHVTRLVTKGRRKGTPFGTGLGMGFCKFRDYSKIPALTNLDVGEYDYEDIGIAFDEVKRQNQLNDQKRSILVEEKVTEQDAYEFCKRYRLLSPHYKDNKRDGCAICPNSNGRELKRWCEDYEGAKECLLYIESICKQWTPGNYPFREHKWFSDYLYYQRRNKHMTNKERKTRDGLSEIHDELEKAMRISGMVRSALYDHQCTGFKSQGEICELILLCDISQEYIEKAKNDIMNEFENIGGNNNEQF